MCNYITSERNRPHHRHRVLPSSSPHAPAQRCSPPRRRPLPAEKPRGSSARGARHGTLLKPGRPGRGSRREGAAPQPLSIPGSSPERGGRARPPSERPAGPGLHSLGRAGPVDGGAIRSGVELDRPRLLLGHVPPRPAQIVTDGTAAAPLRPGPRDFPRRSKLRSRPSAPEQHGAASRQGAEATTPPLRRSAAVDPSAPICRAERHRAPYRQLPTEKNCPGSKCALPRHCGCAHRPDGTARRRGQRARVH